MIKIEKDEWNENEHSVVVLGDDEVAWEISPTLKKALKKELKEHLGGQFSDQFDPIIAEELNDLG